MSERRVLTAAFAVALWCAAAPAASQRQDVDPANQRRRVQALERAWRSAWEAAELAKRGYVATAPFDTVRVGALEIVAHSAIRDQARRVAEIAWSDLVRQFGAEARVAARRRFRLTVAGGSDLPLYGVGPDVVDLSIRRGTGDEAIAAAVFRSASTFVWSHGDEGLRAWLQTERRLRGEEGFAFAAVPMPPRELARWADRQYLALALTPLSLTRDCYAGALAACSAALGLEERDAFTSWFSAADRALLVRSLDGGPRRFVDREATERCARGSDSACLALLQHRWWEVRPPLSQEARALLAAVALELGGAGAYSRLLANPRRPMAQRLAAAAGVSADSLVAAWRARVFAARPDRATTVPRKSLWVLVGWVALFAVAAMRSVTWRHV